MRALSSARRQLADPLPLPGAWLVVVLLSDLREGTCFRLDGLEQVLQAVPEWVDEFAGGGGPGVFPEPLPLFLLVEGLGEGEILYRLADLVKGRLLGAGRDVGDRAGGVDGS
eukprot:CAMPEP_0201113358 /NCGR_PEP_ID=MMETSP0812-20130820/77804_1 /ASSEMBLY_ACC=CAM_ASM_000668 /TAXON_ID=98059 /ORGANISM="Dinobryon sp., Strain UTEXLB2267" /LENGTH=111 /DNA_ID=CAMNT_0047376885 /DNA_START=385 /DNA_END=720 /DNA_ORIENTATION=+